MIRFEKVSKIYPPNCRALNNINLEIKDREFVSIAGRSGAGKSTLIKLLIREDSPTAGRIFYNKQDINEIPKREIPFWRRKTGMVFQDFRLLPDKNAYENIAFAMEVGGRDDADIAKNIPQLLRIVNLSDRAEHFPNQLSGGEKQRVAIARALAHRPEILIADEPTGNLDLLNAWEIVRLLIKINELGTTVILSTHNREIINGLDKRVVTLEKGRIIKDDEKGKYILF
ncbi:MAG: cell division ATP-binding protein FtsE [Candidatus Portnoybacteria bacterium CG_4_8_14_3_um_filter_44_15]|jgi:cell division transport system ATP-binding protein|uniref:Cell division ATP-binding protein FtsE n=4 Tax=Patescibacteria group TaxID=1783273 RepID=A0A2M7YLN9_9BACT|nr:MAG: cell division ATP-binding protein FtsE [Candidatus Portnoybacteria bacterium CG_4_8_14_3_um_filter_44_15]PIZ69795.1 MAG: cell division ATP-binding protein FtsE [Candidatus Portnoybacteria bacterium CG_4_10_14_0_2_um_filter_43_36]PJA63897.1 MAG: cell division ATP-binding protein FtsE [Candidatus Portnoybacteria bacterium CG_4_9_14_3_um_filter_43_11]